eukprot:COSAG02_NODE_2661_length_8306_cov_942.235287_5_plen_284_part_00
MIALEKDDVGPTIGKGGSNIRALQADSGVLDITVVTEKDVGAEGGGGRGRGRSRGRGRGRGRMRGRGPPAPDPSLTAGVDPPYLVVTGTRPSIEKLRQMIEGQIAEREEEANTVKHRLRVNNIPDDFDDEILGEEFEQFGEIREAKVVINGTTGESRGFGFVTFAHRDDMEAAMEEMDGMDVDGYTMAVFEDTGPPGPGGPRGPNYQRQNYQQQRKPDVGSKCYVGGLDFDVGDEALTQAFSGFGCVPSALPPYVSDTRHDPADNYSNPLPNWLCSVEHCPCR